MPLVSVIVPNYNHAKFLQHRLDSIFNQTFQDYEVIILDDHSTDNSVEVLSKYSNHPKVSHFVINPTNSGTPFVQWNKGVGLAKGEIIWIAESDDAAEPDFLATLTKKFVSDSNLSLAYCQSLWFSEANEIGGTWKEYTDDLDSQLFRNPFSMSGQEYIERFLVHKNVIPNASAVLFKREVFQSTGGADEKIRTCSDWLTWLKILTTGSIYFESRALNYFRHHDTSVIANAKKNAVEIGDFEARGGLMRLAFREFLLSIPMDISGKQKLQDVNYGYIISDYGYEGLSQLQKGRWKSGTANILRATFLNGITFRFLKLAIKSIVGKK